MKRTLIGVLLVFVAFAGKLLWDAGVFTTLHPHGSDHCRAIVPIMGAEDMERVSHTLYISADNRPQVPGETTPDGDIYALDLNTPDAPPVRLTPSLSFTFHPHGISTVALPQGVRLFVVNHRQDESVIEVFDHLPGLALTHVRTVRDPLILTPNDVAAIDSEQFYLTNDHGTRDETGKKIEGYTRMGKGRLVFYDGQAAHSLVDGLNFPNGLWVSADKQYLFVALMLSKEVRVYQRENNGVALLRTIDLPAAPDNLQLDAEGALWIAAHPKPLLLKAHAEDHSRPAPSMILRVANPLAEKPVIQNVLTDDGTIVSAASVAVADGKRFFIGTIFTPQLVECPL